MLCDYASWARSSWRWARCCCCSRGSGTGRERQQLLGVRVLRVLHDLVGIAVLHNLALMHHHDAVGKHIDHRQIVG